MSREEKDAFGARMKTYEAVETAGRFDVNCPIYARIDGRGFSKFTRGMARPFDMAMSKAMIATTAALVEATNALIGYTQSDEISLVWQASPGSDVFFSGKKQKMVSVLASLTTAHFMHSLLDNPALGTYADRLPHFDARVFQIEERFEATNAFLWRETDARKNAISMAAHHYYSHKKLQGKSSAEKIAMLAERGVDFEAYPDFFKRGTFLRRETEFRSLTEEERMAIPERHRPPENEQFQRSVVRPIFMPSFVNVANRQDVIFDGAQPIMN